MKKYILPLILVVCIAVIATFIAICCRERTMFLPNCGITWVTINAPIETYYNVSNASICLEKYQNMSLDANHSYWDYNESTGNCTICYEFGAFY